MSSFIPPFFNLPLVSFFIGYYVHAKTLIKSEYQLY